MSLIDAVVLTVLLLLLPGIGIAQARAARRVEAFDRIPTYVSSALAILGLGGVSLWLGLRDGGVARLGLGPVPPDTMVVATLGVLAGAAVVIGAADALRRALGRTESDLLARLLPRTPREKRVFLGLAFAAGLGEEVAYRGYAIPALAALSGGLWGGAVVTSAAFGVVHAYQGWMGIARTALLGMVLAVPLVVLGTVWPSIVAHVIIDLVGGFWLGPRLTREPGTTSGE